MLKIKNFGFQREINFKMIKNNKTIPVLLEIPDIKKNKFTTWGDWGPMFTVYLEKNQSIKINFNPSDPNAKESLTLSVFEVNSPIFYRERKEFPLMYVIPDPKRNFVYHLYMDKDCKICKAKAIDLGESSIKELMCELESLGDKDYV